MPDGYPIQTSFSSGEISPLINGRIDIARYQNGAKRLTNFIVKAQGPIVRRSGTKFKREVKYSDKTTICRKFESSVTATHILEIGDLYIRVHNVLSAAKTTPRTEGPPIEVVTPYLASEVTQLDVTQSVDVYYLFHPNHPPGKLLRNSERNWTYEVIEFQDGPYIDEDREGRTMTLSNVVDVATVKSTVEEFVIGDIGKYIEIDYKGKQVLALILSLVDAGQVTVTIQENTIDYASIDPKTVIDYKVADATFAFPTLNANTSIWSTESENCFIKVDGTWYKMVLHMIKKRLTDFTASGGTTQTFDVMKVELPLPTVLVKTGYLTYSDRVISATLTCSHSVFDPAHIGRQIRLNLETQQVWGTITAHTSTTEVSLELGRMVPHDSRRPSQFIGNGKTVQWRLGAFYPGNYPSCGSFHEERLLLANTPAQPETIWMSNSGDYENMAPTDNDSKVLDSSAITITIAAGKVNSIMWMRSGPILLVGTVGGELQIKSNNLNEAITPSNLNVMGQTEYGTEPYLRGIKVGTSVIFVQKGGRKVREMFYDFNNDSYAAKDISIVSEHLLRENGAAVDFCYQQSPSSLIWIATSSGKLISLTFEKDQEVISWAPHEIAGTDAMVESVATLPTTSGDYLYMIVKRTINKTTKRYLEYMEQEFFPSDRLSKTSMFFVDCGVDTGRVSPITTLTGLDHLEGEMVEVIGDYSYRGTAIVTDGSITIPGGAAGAVQVGLYFRSLVQTLPLEAGSVNGTAQGKVKRVHSLTIRVLHSLGFKHGTDESKLYLHSFVPSAHTQDATPPLISDDLSVTLDQSYNKTGSYLVVQDQPYPLVVLALMPKLSTQI